jgi:AraC family transcriptional regulator of adaptative response/methylated-DNA-[protein]-cysteine methyltransferase
VYVSCMNDYERIARIIRYLDEHYVEQPSLEELAAVAGLSVSRFHRLFSAWAGVTPKEFLQALTLAHARRVLREGESVLGAALDSGLSGPGRLHDLCVTLEAVSPGELKKGGEGLDIVYGTAESPFGKCLLAETSRGICHLSFVDEGAKVEVPAELMAEWPLARVRRSDAVAARRAGEIFVRGSESRQRGQPLRAWVTGTSFQLRVWRALLQVPRGELTTYGRLARAIGSGGASRAVGSAVGANPLAYLIPCHRVIRQTGALGGYRWGGERKRVLVAWETAADEPTLSK